MKQTKSALTMLLAHYRAIYKHAILAAFVAASTLGASSSVAAPATPAESFEKPIDGVITVGADGVTIKDQTKKMQPSKKLQIDGDLTFDSSAGAIGSVGTPYEITATDEINLTTGKTLTVGKTGGEAVVKASAKTVNLDGNVTTDVQNTKLSFDRTGAKDGKGTLTATGKITVGADTTLELKNYVADLLGGELANSGEVTLDATSLLKINEKDVKKGKITLGGAGSELYVKATDANAGFKLADTSIADTLINGTGKLLTDHAVIETAFGAKKAIDIVAEKLTYGKDGAAALADTVNLNSLTATKELVVGGNASGGAVVDNISLDNKTTEPGVISGSTTTKDKIAIGATDKKATVSVANGLWVSDADITLKADTTDGNTGKGTLAITADSTKKLAGTFVLGEKGKLTIEEHASVSVGNSANTSTDYQATLDLTKGTITETSAGKITLDKAGTLKISESNLANLISTTGAIDYAATADKSSQLIIQNADGTAGNLNIDASTVGTNKDKLLKDGFKGKVVANNLIVTGIDAAGGLTITGGATKDSILDMTSADFTATDSTKAIVKLDKLTLNVTDGLKISNESDAKLGELTLGVTASTGTSILNLEKNDNGKLSISKLVLDKGSIVSVDGTWTLDDAATDVTLTTATDSIIIKNNSSLKTNAKLTAGGSTLEITGANSSAEFKGLEVKTADTTVVKGGGKLIINGDGDIKTKDLTLTNKITISGDSSLVLKNDTLEEVISGTGTAATVKNDIVGKISTTDNSEVVLDYAQGTKLSQNLITELSKGFKASGTFNGFINLGGAELDGTLTVENNHFKWADYKDLANVNVTSESLKNAVADTTKTEATTGVYGSVGAVNVTEALNKTDKVNFAGSTVLSNAKANGGKFVSAKDSDKALDVTVTENSNLSLHNGGEIGAITLGTTNSNLVVKGGDTVVNGAIIGTASEASFIGTKATVKDAVNVQSIDLDQANVVLAKQADVKSFAANKGSNLTAKNVNVTITENTVNGVKEIAKSTIENSTATISKLNLSGTTPLTATNKTVLSIADNGTLVVEGTKTVTDADGKLSLTKESLGEIQIGEYKKGADNAVTGSNGTMFVRDSSELKGVINVTSGTEKASFAIFANEIKPAEIQPSEPVPGPKSAPIAMTLGAGTGAGTPPVAGNPNSGLTPPGSTDGVKDPTPYTLQHTAKVGANSAVAYGYNSIDELMSDMKTNNLMTEKGGIKDGRAIAVVNTSTTIDSTTTNGKGSIVLGDSASVTPIEGGVYLGDKSAIIVTDNAFGFNNDKTALTVKAGGIQIAKDTDGKTNKDTKVILTGAFTSGDVRNVLSNGALATGETLDLETATGMLVGKIDSTGTVKLAFNDKFNSSAVFNKASTPVRDYLVGMGKGEVENVIKDKVAAKKDEMTQFTQGLTTALDGGQTLEQAARFAVYGGSIKAAELATKSGSDAIKSYASANANVATAQTDMGSFFVVPTYKTSDSDSFNAEGLDFGSDINLSGVALGADFVVAPAVKLGAMFNIGTGDSKGQGAAEGIESDLDYVGGGFFVNYNQDNINVVADITYTQSSADMTGNVTAQGKYNQMKAEADTKALSLGVQGEYKVDLDTSYATPYAGVRITKYDMDGYTVQLDGNDFITNNFDSMTVLSVPVGVKLGTEIVSGDWSLAPSLDLGVTFNLGDTDLSHSAQAVSKVQGMALSTEVIDDVVFGIKGGLKANYQALSLGLGLGYEMGSNSDDLSVQGTVKYTF